MFVWCFAIYFREEKIWLFRNSLVPKIKLTTKKHRRNNHIDKRGSQLYNNFEREKITNPREISAAVLWFVRIAEFLRTLDFACMACITVSTSLWIPCVSNWLKTHRLIVLGGLIRRSQWQNYHNGRSLRHVSALIDTAHSDWLVILTLNSGKWLVP